MLLSYKWLQSYFKDKLPAPEEVERDYIFHSFEVESREDKLDDVIFDIKVLPNRAHDCLGHRGLAADLAAIRGLKISANKLLPAGEAVEQPVARDLKINIEDSKLCRRYVGRMVEGVKLGPAPSWMRERLEAMGQKSISNIVDATNFVMFDLGQPLHAFDADRVAGGITVRLARSGEKMLTLDNKEIELDPSVLVIADDEAPLAIAGIKGGKKAEVTAETKNIILESANFDPANTRRATVKTGIKTDASKRFENNLSPAVAGEAMKELSVLLQDILGPEAKFGPVVDAYPTPQKQTKINFTAQEINAILGVEIPESEIAAILERLGFEYTNNGGGFEVAIPFERLDLETREDMAEEIGRLYGYDKIVNRLPIKTEAPVNERFASEFAAKKSLLDLGFAEIQGYAFTNQGEVAVANPLASDKGFLRQNLSDFLKEKAAIGVDNQIFERELVKFFEIGKIFLSEDGVCGEKTSLALVVAGKQRKKAEEEVLAEIKRALETLNENLSLDLKEEEIKKEIQNSLIIFSLEKEFNPSKEISAYPDLSDYIRTDIRYKKISPFPKIVRDIALFVEEGTDPVEIASVIKEAAGPLLFEGPIKFDEFHKDGKVSYAFRSIFQSYEKTLSDEEVNAAWQKVEEAVKAKGWEVR